MLISRGGGGGGDLRDVDLLKLSGSTPVGPFSLVGVSIDFLGEMLIG